MKQIIINVPNNIDIKDVAYRVEQTLSLNFDDKCEVVYE